MRRGGDISSTSMPVPAQPAAAGQPARSDWATLKRLLPYLWQ